MRAIAVSTAKVITVFRKKATDCCFAPSRSGDYAVRAPNYKWNQLIERMANFNYGHICIVVNTEYITGYDGYPGCQLWFYPGRKDGYLDDDLKLQPPKALAKSHGHNGAFGISTSVKEAVLLRDALDKAIRNSQARQKEE